METECDGATSTEISSESADMLCGFCIYLLPFPSLYSLIKVDFGFALLHCTNQFIFKMKNAVVKFQYQGTKTLEDKVDVLLLFFSTSLSQEYIIHVDPASQLGLNSDSVLGYSIGEIVRTNSMETPELLPCGYLVGENNTISVTIKGKLQVIHLLLFFVITGFARRWRNLRGARDIFMSFFLLPILFMSFFE